jgi:hypothetical protein
MTCFGAIHLFCFIVGNLFHITVTADAGKLPVYRLVEKVGVYVKIVECTFLIIGPQSPVLVTEEAVLRIPRKNRDRK